jgi:hypothetical protein
MHTKCKNNLVNLLAVVKGGALTGISESTSLQADVVKCYYMRCGSGVKDQGYFKNLTN